MELKHTKKTIIEVDYRDLEEFVKEKYPQIKDYSFVATELCENDSDHTFSVKHQDIREFEKKVIESIRNTGHIQPYENHGILNMLLQDGYIEEGEYLVNVCW